MITLGIETSCDETSCALVEEGSRVLSLVVASQMELHRKWGGVVPELASRRHVELILPVLRETLEQANITWEHIDAIAVTNRPGLVGALLVGVSAAKALAWVHEKPIVPVHHLSGHLYSAWLEQYHVLFPHICLIVSGGHTEIILARGHGDLTSMGATVDDAAGECFDKCARLMGLPYPGGPEVDRLAEQGDPRIVDLPRARMGDSCKFSFSGLKTAVRYFLERDHGVTPITDVCAGLRQSVVDVLVEKTVRAAEIAGVTTITVVGGVAANMGLRSAMTSACSDRGWVCRIPSLIYCTDNAAMIAAAGFHELHVNGPSRLDFNTFATSRLSGEPEKSRLKD